MSCWENRVDPAISYLPKKLSAVLLEPAVPGKAQLTPQPFFFLKKAVRFRCRFFFGKEQLILPRALPCRKPRARE